MTELPPLTTLVATRKALHRVAEHVLSAARKTATGHIGLVPSPGGFQTPKFAGDDGDRVVAVNGTDIEVRTSSGVRREPLTTVRAAATLAGIEPGFPWTTHPPATPVEPDDPLAVDAAAAQVLAGWFALGAEALARLARTAMDDQPGPAQIYPEHFDLGVVIGAVNYGVSPGDEAIPLPYLYVGPHDGVPAADAFWNASFGAYVTIEQVGSVEDASAFFEKGRRLLRETTAIERPTPS